MVNQLKAVIFDFDGTIADTFGVLQDILERIMPEMGYPKFTNTEWEVFRNSGTQELLKTTKIGLLGLMKIVKRMQVELNKRLVEVKPFRGVAEVMAEFKKSGIEVGIISSDSKENIEQFLRREKMEVDWLLTGNNLFGKDKLIKKYLKQRGLELEEVVYVGDEVRDVEACLRAGVRVAAVTWGFNTKEVLLKSQPDWVVENPRELAKLVLTLSQEGD